MRQQTLWVETTQRKLIRELGLTYDSYFFNLKHDASGKDVDGYKIPSNTDIPFLIELLKEYDVFYFIQ